MCPFLQMTLLPCFSRKRKATSYIYLTSAWELFLNRIVIFIVYASHNKTERGVEFFFDILYQHVLIFTKVEIYG